MEGTKEKNLWENRMHMGSREKIDGASTGVKIDDIQGPVLSPRGEEWIPCFER